MNAATFRRNIPKFEEELVLNVCYEADESYHVLAMIARQKGKLYMWEISAIAEEEEERKQRRWHRPRTNRAMHKEAFERAVYTHIKEIRIFEQELSVSSATGSCIGENDEDKVLLFYFLQKGVLLGRFEHVPFERLRITKYELYEKENGRPYDEQEPKYRWKLPSDKQGDIQVTVQIDKKHVEVPVHKRMVLKFGEYKKPRVLQLTDGTENIEVYIHAVSRYDTWEKEKTRFDDPRYKENFTEDELLQMKDMHLKAMEATCPRGHVIPLIEYECNMDYQMQFYTLQYLRKECENRNTSVIMMFKSDKKIGPLGYRNMVCELEAVPADYDESLQVELFMYYKIVPEETIECKSIESEDNKCYRTKMI